MKVLLTGGCGFIGSNLVHYLLKQKDVNQVINIDALTYAGNPANLEAARKDKRYKFIKADIANAGEVRKIFKKFTPELVLNLAAESHVDRSILDASAFLRTNILGAQVLLESSREFQAKRYVQVSTDEVYGSLGPRGKFVETTPIAPNSPYAASKASADLMVRAAHHTFHQDVVITRCSNNYGPYQFPEKLIPLMITNALQNLQLPVYGDGMNVRDWIHVEDHCSGIWEAALKGKPGEVYNFGADNEWPNIKIVKLILKLLNKPESLIKYVKDRPGHDRRYAMGAAKARKELKWIPRWNFKEGLEKTIEWYCSNESWWRDIKSGNYLKYYQKQYGGRL